MMRRMAFGLLTLLALAQAASASNVRWSIGVNLGAPPVVVRPYPHYHYHHFHRPYYYAPAPVIVRPAPIVYEPAPVVIQQPVVVAPAPTPAPTRVTSGSSVVPAVVETPGSVDTQLHLLRNPDEKVRADAAIELGRTRSDRAVDALCATLAGDKSPAVRDSAARGLGLIGSSKALTALNYAASADPDRDVRRSAQFAVEIIQSNRRD